MTPMNGRDEMLAQRRSDTVTEAGNVVEVEGLTKVYGGHAAVDRLNVSIRRGEVYGFLGPNGGARDQSGRRTSSRASRK